MASALTIASQEWFQMVPLRGTVIHTTLGADASQDDYVESGLSTVLAAFVNVIGTKAAAAIKAVPDASNAGRVALRGANSTLLNSQEVEVIVIGS
jgi:hypothetical protein